MRDDKKYDVWLASDLGYIDEAKRAQVTEKINAVKAKLINLIKSIRKD